MCPKLQDGWQIVRRIISAFTVCINLAVPILRVNTVKIDNTTPCIVCISHSFRFVHMAVFERGVGAGWIK